MMNPFFNPFGKQQAGPFNNAANLVNQFNQFKSSFQGDPRQQVQNLLNSGQMTQDQFNQFSTMAQMFQNLLNTFRG